MTPAMHEALVGADDGHPRYAIVVATRDRGAKIVPLLESIRANEEEDFELVIVDQSSTDDTESAVAPFLEDQRIRYVHSSVPGTSRARNLGISLTRAPIIAITDDDCIVPRNWLTSIARPFAEYPRVGVVFCSVEPLPVDPPGFTPHILFSGSRIISNVMDAWTSARKGLSLGAGMAVRRAMTRELGGFDEMLGPGAKFGSTEDNDLSWRGMLRGWSTFQSAEVTVVHDGSRTLDEVRHLVIRDSYGIGGTIAKYLRAGEVSALWFLGAWLTRSAVIGPACDLLAGRRPRGFRGAFMVVRGVLDGLHAPFDRYAVMYRHAPDAAIR